MMLMLMLMLDNIEVEINHRTETDSIVIVPNVQLSRTQAERVFFQTRKLRYRNLIIRVFFLMHYSNRIW